MHHTALGQFIGVVVNVKLNRFKSGMCLVILIFPSFVRVKQTSRTFSYENKFPGNTTACDKVRKLLVFYILLVSAHFPIFLFFFSFPFWLIYKHIIYLSRFKFENDHVKFP